MLLIVLTVRRECSGRTAAHGLQEALTWASYLPVTLADCRFYQVSDAGYLVPARPLCNWLTVFLINPHPPAGVVAGSPEAYREPA
jgi:hypothetical protein